MATQIIHKDLSQRIIWVLIFFIPWLFIWQDGDLADTGINATLYHFFFDRINDNVTDSIIFLTELVGGIWFRLFPTIGLLNIKILAILFLYGNVIISHRILRKLFPNSSFIAISLLVSIVFIIRCFPLIFNYDLITTFFLLLIVLCLQNINTRTRNKSIFMVSVVTALAIFARLPNILLLIAIPFCILLGSYLKLIYLSFREVLRVIIIYLLTTLLSITAIYILIQLLGWGDIYLENLLKPTDLINKESGYTFSKVLYIYTVDLVYFIIYFSIILFLFKTLQYAIKQHIIKGEYIGIGLVILALGLLSLYPFTFNYNNSIKYIVPSLVFISLLKARLNNQLKWIVLLVFSFIVIQIAGSNTGIFLKSSLLFILLIPVAINSLLERNFLLNSILSKVVLMYTFGMSLFIYSIFIYGVGQGPLIRFKAIHSPQIDKYKNLYTTQSLANQIKLTTKDLIKYRNGDNSELFIYGHEPIFYYLADIKPADKEIWLIGNSLSNPKDVLNRLILKKKRPIILRTHQDIFDVKTNSLLDKFINENKYKLVKSSEFYDIWIPIY